MWLVPHAVTGNKTVDEPLLDKFNILWSADTHDVCGEGLTPIFNMLTDTKAEWSSGGPEVNCVVGEFEYIGAGG